MIKAILTSIGSVKAGKALMASSVAFTIAMYRWLDQSTQTNWEAILASVIGVVVVLVSLYTVISNAKNDTARVQQDIILGLRKDLAEERANSLRYAGEMAQTIARLNKTIEDLTAQIKKQKVRRKSK